MIKPYQITVGGGGNNPSAGDTDWNYTDLQGVDGFLDKNGFGTWNYENYQLLSTGGVRLLNGFKFLAGEIYFFHPTGIVYNTTAGNYTNGFDFNKVMTAMFSRIGFRQPTKTGYSSLLTTLNLTSTSGRYFNDFHADCTASNLLDCQDDKDMGSVSFNTYAESLKKSVIMRALTGVFSAPEYIEQVLLYDREIENVIEEPLANENKFVGYAINISASIDKAVQLHAVTLLFDTDCTFTLHLFKEGKKSSIWTQSVSVVANEATVVNISNLVLNYIGDTVKGTRYYLGYFQSDLGSARALNETPVCWNKTCVFGVNSFSAPEDSGNFDRTQVSRGTRTYGMNLEMSSFKDWTQIIVKRPNVYDELIGLTMAYVVLEQIVYAMRSNQNQRLLAEGLQLASLIQDLTGSAPISDGPAPVTGLNKRIEREVKRVKDSLLPRIRSQIVNLC